MAAWATSIETITLFVRDVGASKAFYQRTLGAVIVFEDDESAVFRLGDVLVNVLDRSAAGELVEPRRPADGTAPTAVLTIRVDDVDAVCAGLGAPLLNGPLDRPWGRRTAAFEDPDGHVWELAQEIPN